MTHLFQGSLKALLLALSVLLASLGMSSRVWADEPTTPGGSDDWEIIEVDGNSAYFSLLDRNDCNDPDDYCAVEVEITSAVPNAHDDMNTEEEWAAKFEELCGSGGSSSYEVRGSPGSYGDEFEECWAEYDFDVVWPHIQLDDKFDISGHCDGYDDTCAVELVICYNPHDCDQPRNNEGEYDDADRPANDIGEFWQDAGNCLYDNDEDDVWECIDDEFEDWLDDLNRNDDYDDLLEELHDATEDDDYGVAIADYDGDRNDVPGRHRARTVSAKSRARTTAASYTTRPVVYLPPLATGVQRYAPPYGDYVVANFTQHLEAAPHSVVCGTSLGCIRTVGASRFFASYMGNLSVVIDENAALRCLRNRGYRIGRGGALAFNDPALIACDRRIADANRVCPEAGTGAKAELLAMWNLGLFSHLIPQTLAYSMQSDLTRASLSAPGCLCSAGFRNADIVATSSASDNPWEPGAATSATNFCHR